MQLWIHCTVIRVSRDQRLFDSYPELIAVFHALHRLLAPRHPPHALSSLAALFLPFRLRAASTPEGAARASDSKNRTRQDSPFQFREADQKRLVTFFVL